ncbi:hypothetical protein ACFL54_00470 [Planctomycetota bacterium]
MRNKKACGGIVLLIVLGVLALLSVLAITFVSITRLERGISKTYMDYTHAILAAESGVEYAISRITNLSGGVLTAAEAKALSYQENPDNPGLDFVTRPSFQLAAPLDQYSGIISSTYSASGDRYKLKVEDESGKLNLNDTDGLWNPDSDPDPDDPENDPELVNAPRRLRMLVENLGDILFEAPKGTNISNTLFDARENLPGRRFTTMRQVKDLLVPDILDAHDFQELTKHITLWSWQDPDTIRPTFQLHIATPPGEDNFPVHAERDVYLFSDWQTKGFTLEPRCPVNVNTAGKELIEALIAPLQGWYLREGPGEAQTATHYEPWYYSWTESYSGRWAAEADFGQTVYNYYHTDNTERMLTMCGANESGFISHETRYGEARLTPIDDAYPGFALDKLRQNFSKDLATAIYDHIHGDQSTDPNPIETWQEFEWVLSGLLETLLPDSDSVWYGSNAGQTDSNDIFWSAWTPGPEGYDLSTRYHSSGEAGVRMDYVRDYVALGGAAEVTSAIDPIDIPYWAGKCRRILLDLLLANFNPNSAIQDFNPDRHLYRHIDKAHLTQYSTEFIFEPTGCFSIQSLGVIKGPTDENLCLKEIKAIVKVFEMARITTQQQFMKGLTGSNLDDYCTSTAYTNVPFDSAYDCSLISYPEPYLAGLELAEYVEDSRFDGFLMCSTYAPGTTGSGARFVVDFEGGLSVGSTGLSPAYYDPAGLSNPDDPYDPQYPPGMWVSQWDKWWHYALWGDGFFSARTRTRLSLSMKAASCPTECSCEPRLYGNIRRCIPGIIPEYSRIRLCSSVLFPCRLDSRKPWRWRIYPKTRVSAWSPGNIRSGCRLIPGKIRRWLQILAKNGPVP